MTRLLTIDPGARTGLALFEDGRLTYAECHNFDKALHMLRTLQLAPTHMVIEIPRVYPAGKQPVNPNDLITLAVRAGRLIQAAGCYFAQIFPSDWKKQVPDDILYTRILRELKEKEREVVAAARCAKYPTTAHNMMDAVGIGLVQLGRVGAGITRKASNAPTDTPGRAPEASHRPVPASTPARAARTPEAKATARAARKVPEALLQTPDLAAPADAQGVLRGATRKPRKAAQHE